MRRASQGYQWDCIPGKWLIYTLLLALPFPAVAVRPDPVNPIWRCELTGKRRVRGVVPKLDLRGMPESLPLLPAAQYSLPEAVGRLYDCTILSSDHDALRPLADAWCQLAMGNLLRVGSVVSPLRTAADAKRDVGWSRRRRRFVSCIHVEYNIIGLKLRTVAHFATGAATCPCGRGPNMSRDYGALLAHIP